MNRAGQKSRRQSALLEGAMEKLSLEVAANTSLPPSSPPNGISQFDAPDMQRTPVRTSSIKTPSRRTSTPLLNRKPSTSSLHGSTGAGSPRPGSRRSSQTPDLNAPGSRSPLAEYPEKPPSEPLTATAVAHTFFTEELKLHERGIQNDSRTTVILQDACFGHRYSRPKTTKANLSTVVERPERIHASILGVAAAYVCLGKRHTEGLHAPHPSYDHSTISSIPFKIKKSDRALPLTSPPAVAVHGAKWMEELRVMCDAAEAKLALNGKELVRPPSAGGNEDKPPLHEGDLYLCGESLNAMQGSLGAVCEGVDTVFGSVTDKNMARKAFVCIRPPGHHCSASYPSGFCWLNNVHVGIAHGAITHGLTHAAIVDFDLHHGDGSQAITWEHNAKVARMPRNASNAKKTSIGYFSLHDINSYPCEMGDFEKVRNASVCVENAHGQTIWNVHLEPWKNADEFWSLYETKYRVLLDKTRDYLKQQTQRFKALGVPPKAVIFLSSGFDASEWEGAGMQRHKVNVPTDFYARFTSDLVKIAEEEGTGADGRVISVLEGGYSDRALCSGVWSHLSGLTGFQETDSEASIPTHGLAAEMGRLNGMEVAKRSIAKMYTPAWWTLPRIEALEAAANPTPTPPPPPKKVRTSGTPTYATSTQSFNAKMVSPNRRSASQSSLSLSQQPSRAPTPPPPDVDWAAAAHGLRKALVPTNRDTKSHKPEALAPETQRAKRERQSILGIPAADNLDGKRMTLRDRKGRDAVSSIPEDAEKVMSRSDRRKTVASGFGLGIDNISNGPAPPRVTHTRRRSSIASTMSSVTENSRDSVPPEPLSVPPVSAPKNVAVKREPAARLAVNKTRPVPKAPVRPRIGRAATNPPEESAVAPSADTDFDALANGMKTMSIKLNMPSREEHEAREKKRIEEAKLAKGPKKAPVKPRAPAKKAPGKAPVPLRPIPPAVAAQRELEVKLEQSEPKVETLPEVQPEIKLETPAPTEVEFIQYKVPPPQPDAIKQEPLIWLPPNTSTPPAESKKAVHTFTSTSAIPFAPRPQEKRVMSSESEASTKDGPSSDTTETMESVTESEQGIKAVFDVPVSP